MAADGIHHLFNGRQVRLEKRLRAILSRLSLPVLDRVDLHERLRIKRDVLGQQPNGVDLLPGTSSWNSRKAARNKTRKLATEEVSSASTRFGSRPSAGSPPQRQQFPFQLPLQLQAEMLVLNRRCRPGDRRRTARDATAGCPELDGEPIGGGFQLAWGEQEGRPVARLGPRQRRLREGSRSATPSRRPPGARCNWTSGDKVSGRGRPVQYGGSQPAGNGLSDLFHQFFRSHGIVLQAGSPDLCVFVG